MVILFIILIAGVCVRIFPRITAAAAALSGNRLSLTFIVSLCACTPPTSVYCLFCWSLFFFSRYLLLFFRLVLSAGQLKRVLNEPMRTPQYNILLSLLLLPVYYCNYGGSGKRVSSRVPVRYYFYCNINIIYQ